MFAGLDAWNYPTSISTMLLPWIECASNVGAVTWTGDLGSVVAETLFFGVNHSNRIAAADMIRIADEYAPPQDMLGNIDAWVIADAFNITNAAGAKVSDILSGYYLDADTSAGGTARTHRYSRFCRLTGLTGWTGVEFGNEPDWVAKWKSDVAAAATFYVGASTSGVWGAACRAGYALGFDTDPLVDMIVRDFLTCLKQRVAEEPT